MLHHSRENIMIRKVASLSPSAQRRHHEKNQIAGGDGWALPKCQHEGGVIIYLPAPKEPNSLSSSKGKEIQSVLLALPCKVTSQTTWCLQPPRATNKVQKSSWHVNPSLQNVEMEGPHVILSQPHQAKIGKKKDPNHCSNKFIKRISPSFLGGF